MDIYRDNNFKQSNFKAGLYLISTPIGNLSDISFRSLLALEKLDEIFCEDTSKTIKLLSFFNISRSLKKYHEFSNDSDRNKILGLLQEGKSVGLVSDAGTPTISDPGYKLVNTARKLDIDVFAIAGPTALIAALSVSGLPTDKFFFSGFCPRKRGDKESAFMVAKKYKSTLIFYETAVRLKATLELLDSFFPGQEICLAREITKKHEELISGDAKEVLAKVEEQDLKGEIVLLVDNNNDSEEGGVVSEVSLELDDLVKLFADDVPPSKLAAKLSKMFKLQKGDVYKAILEVKKPS